MNIYLMWYLIFCGITFVAILVSGYIETKMILVQDVLMSIIVAFFPILNIKAWGMILETVFDSEWFDKFMSWRIL